MDIIFLSNHFFVVENLIFQKYPLSVMWEQWWFLCDTLSWFLFLFDFLWCGLESPFEFEVPSGIFIWLWHFFVLIFFIFYFLFLRHWFALYTYARFLVCIRSITYLMGKVFFFFSVDVWLNLVNDIKLPTYLKEDQVII